MLLVALILFAWSWQTVSAAPLLRKESSRPMAAGVGLLFGVEAGHITAKNAGSGTIQWRLHRDSGYGMRRDGTGGQIHRLGALLLCHNGVLYSVSDGGKACAIDARTGHILWAVVMPISKTEESPQALEVDKDEATLIVTCGNTVFAYDLKTGQQLVHIKYGQAEHSEEGQIMGAAMLTKKFVIVSGWYEGAYTAFGVNGYDRTTGKSLWGCQGKIEGVGKDTMSIVDTRSLADENSMEIIRQIIDINTGKVLSVTQQKDPNS